jgi:hypothetical protein
MKNTRLNAFVILTALAALSPLAALASPAPKYSIFCQATLTSDQGKSIQVSSIAKSSEAPSTKIDLGDYSIDASFERKQIPMIPAYKSTFSLAMIKKDHPESPLEKFSADSETELSSFENLNFIYQGSNISKVQYSCRLSQSGPTAKELADAINSDPCRKTVEDAFIAFGKNEIKNLADFGYDPDACKIADSTQFDDVLLSPTTKSPSKEVPGATHYMTLVNCRPNFPLPASGESYSALVLSGSCTPVAIWPNRFPTMY